MMAWGVLPDLRCYESLIDVHAHHGAAAAAVVVLDRIEAAGLEPGLDTYRRLLHGLGAWGDLSTATHVSGWWGWGGVGQGGLGLGWIGLGWSLLGVY